MLKHKLRGRLSLLLALCMIFTMAGLTLTSCEDYDDYGIFDYDYYGEETDSPDSTAPETESIPDRTEQESQAPPETQAEPEQQTEAETEPETEAQTEPENQPEPETAPETEPQTEPETQPETEPETEPTPDLPDEDGTYDDRDNVALYIHTYGKLPPNYITKREAEDLGWSGGSLEKYAQGKCIGGSKFGNYEGLLPKAKGRQYYECDIDTLGEKSRGAKRIVYSNDGLIYYTDDHYESFELLYGEEDE